MSETESEGKKGKPSKNLYDEGDLLETSSESTVSMPPAPDGGWGWIIVLSGFVTMMISDGIAFSFGVLYTELVNYFDESKSLTSWVGSLYCAVPMICGPLASALATKYGCRKVAIFGGFVAFAGLFASMFANSIPVLCFTFGIVAGFGMSMGYVTSVVMVAFYFEKKRALTTGLAVCGSGIGTFVFAPLIEVLIEWYGWRGTMLILSGISLNLVLCGAVLRPLEFSAEEKWRRALLTFEKMSRSISRASLPDSSHQHSRHASHSDELESSCSESQEEIEHLCYSQVALPTYITDKQEELPAELIKKLRRNDGSNVQQILQQYFRKRNMSSNAAAHDKLDESEKLTVTSNDYIFFSKQRGLKESEAAPTTSRSGGDQSQQKKRTPIAQYYPLYRKDLFYRGNLMRLPSLRCKSSSCPELYNWALNDEDDDDEEDDEDYCSLWKVLRFSKHVKKVLRMMFDFSILCKPLFIFYCVSSFVLYFWYDVPYVFQTDRAIEFGMNDTMASYLIAVLGVLNTLGQVIYGYLGDRSINLTMFYGLSIILCGLTVIFVPFFEEFIPLAVLTGAFGLFISSNYALSTVILVEFVGIDKLTSAYGLTLLVQGVANLIGPPVAGWMYDDTGSYDSAFYVAGSFISMSGLMLCIIPPSKWLIRRCREQMNISAVQLDNGKILQGSTSEHNGCTQIIGKEIGTYV